MSTEGKINLLSSWANLKIPYLRYRNPIFASNIADFDTDLLQKYLWKSMQIWNLMYRNYTDIHLVPIYIMHLKSYKSMLFVYLIVDENSFTINLFRGCFNSWKSIYCILFIDNSQKQRASNFYISNVVSWNMLKKTLSEINCFYVNLYCKMYPSIWIINSHI